MGLLEVRRGYSRLQGVTRGYRGYKWLHEVTKGYKRLQWVTRGCRELQRLQVFQGVTRSNDGLQGITGG